MTEITDGMRDKLLAKRPLLWATIIPSRTTKGAVSLHVSQAHAKNAVRASSPEHGRMRRYPYDASRGGSAVAEAEVYELVNGEWILRWAIEDGTYPNELPWGTK